MSYSEYKYKGYLITKQSYGWSISQGGFAIDATKTLSEAKQLIKNWSS